MHLLFETPLGYALFNVDEDKFNKVTSWEDLPSSTQGIQKLLQLKAFKEFKDSKEVLRASVKLLYGKLSKNLKKFLQQNKITKELNEKLLVGDKKIATEISKKLGIKCFNNDLVTELIRCIRSNMEMFLGDINQEEMKNMALGLAHGLGRFKIKFSADKVDIMIMQAVNLYEDLDKEINNYMMRLREWYGYHFPELTKILPDNLVYTKVVKLLGMKENYQQIDFTDLVGEELNKEIHNQAEISMGTEITEEDIESIIGLADQIIELFEYRDNLEDYLKNRMMAVAPNLSMVVGEIIAAKLISKAGSLVNLAKCSASTIQIMGAEKALFKAMKTKKKTPKYGIIYQSKIVANANGRAKGKISRALAAKGALCIRFDALNEQESNDLGMQSKEYLEKRLVYLEKEENSKGGAQKQSYGKSFGGDKQGGYNSKGDVNLQKRNKSNDHSKGSKKFKNNQLNFI